MIYSKFRPLSIEDCGLGNNCKLFKNNKHTFDILSNERLYANKFDNFNDILDCVFYFDKTENEKLEDFLKRIYDKKNERNICCFSKKFQKNNQKEHLMWAHYANNHFGIRIDFELKEHKAIEVKYGKYPFIHNIEECLKYDNYVLDKKSIEFIMTCESEIWKYEQEYRVIIDEEFVPIKINQIVIGRAFCKNDKVEEVANIIRNELKTKDITIKCYKDRYSNDLKTMKFDEQNI